MPQGVGYSMLPQILGGLGLGGGAGGMGFGIDRAAETLAASGMGPPGVPSASLGDLILPGDKTKIPPEVGVGGIPAALAMGTPQQATGMQGLNVAAAAPSAAAAPNPMELALNAAKGLSNIKSPNAERAPVPQAPAPRPGNPPNAGILQLLLGLQGGGAAPQIPSLGSLIRRG